MKWLYRVSLQVGLVLAIAATALADERTTLLSCYNQLKTNAIQAQATGGVKSVRSQIKGMPQKFDLAGPCEVQPVPVPVIVPNVAPPPPLRLGVKVWAQLIDAAGNPGAFVNLSKYKWHPNERFWLWFDAAVPLTVALFQNYPQGIMRSRQVSPDERFPETFGSVMPGKPFRFPIPIKMDDNLINEQMSIVVARCDAPALVAANPTVQAQAAATACASAIIDTTGLAPGARLLVEANASASAGVAATPAAAAQAAAQAAATLSPSAEALTMLNSANDPATGTLKGLAGQRIKNAFAQINKGFMTAQASSSASAGQSKFVLAPPPAAAPPISTQFEDVEILIMGPGNLAQLELTLFK